MPCQMNSQKGKRKRQSGMHRANRCYKQLPVPCLSATSESPPVWWAGRYDGPGGRRASPTRQGLSSLSSPTRICWQFFRKTLFWSEKRGLIHHQFKALVQVHTLTILPNRHFSSVYCFPLIFSLPSFLQNGTLQLPKTGLLPVPWLPPFPPSADHTGSKCPGEASLTYGRVSFQLLWKNERTQFIRVPACRENKFRPCQKDPVPRPVVFY